jgi:hypothetical protein
MPSEHAFRVTPFNATEFSPDLDETESAPQDNWQHLRRHELEPVAPPLSQSEKNLRQPLYNIFAAQTGTCSTRSSCIASVSNLRSSGAVAAAIDPNNQVRKM